MLPISSKSRSDPVKVLHQNSAHAAERLQTGIGQLEPRYRLLPGENGGRHPGLCSDPAAAGYSVARDRLADAESRLKALLQEPGKLSAQLVAVQGNLETLQKSHDTTLQEKEKLDKELETIRRTASDAIRISNERNELRKLVAQLTHQVEELKQDNRELSNNSNQKWFMIGAGIIILGIVIGLILPHLRFQRRKTAGVRCRTKNFKGASLYFWILVFIYFDELSC